MHASPATLALFAKFLAQSMGLHFPEERLFELDQKMIGVAKEAGYRQLDEYLLWLMSAPLPRELLEQLALALTIGETYFLRDPRSYQVLAEELVPELVAQRRKTEKSLKIWSAGCSTGEEPYTLAILLSRIIPDLADWNLSIMATDINPLALERGRRGIYSKWSFRNSPAWLMDYFSKCEDGRFEIVPRIRSMVRFDHLNLADPASTVPCGGTDFVDVIFCRNVMLYFEPLQIDRTMARFQAALREGGWLFVGPTEVDQRFLTGFTCQRFPGAFVLKKETQKQQAAPGAGRAKPVSVTTRGACGAATAPPDNLASPRRSAGAVATCQVAAPASSGQGGPPRSPSRAPSPEAIPTVDLQGERAAATELRTDVPDGYPEALVLYQAGCYEQAADTVRRALDAGPQPAETLALGARAFANVGRFTEARRFCEQAIAADRLSVHNHYLLSIILEQQGDVAAAETSLKNVLFLDQDYLLAYFALGNLSRQAGDEGESERHFKNALRLLERRDPHEVLPEAEGMTAGRLAQMIRAMTRGRGEHGNG